MPKVLIPTKLNTVAADLFNKNNYDVVQDSDSDVMDLVKANPDTEIVIVRSEKITSEIIDALPKLKLVVRAGAGYNTIDINYARFKGVDVMNTPGANSNAVAEEVIALWLAAYRNIVRGDISTREGLWEKKKLMGRELTGKTIGIIGLGHIGRLVIKRLQGFEMKFLAYDPFVSASDINKELDVKMCTMEEIFAEADCVSLHIPENDKTRGVINKELLSKMKNGKLWKNYWWTNGDYPDGYYNNPWHVWRPAEDQPDPQPEPEPVPDPEHGIQTWNASTVYDQAGYQVTYNGTIYENHWWTQGDSPAGYESNQWYVWRPVGDDPNPNPDPDPPIPDPDTNAVIEPLVNIPGMVFAPYVDILLWPTHSIYSTFNITNQKFYTLAFIQSGTDGTPMWGGVQTVKDNTTGSVFYSGEINSIRENYGDVIISFGGAAGTPLAEKITSTATLVEAYQYIIDTYKVQWIDFDIEGIWVADADSIARRNEALVIIQENNPDLKTAFCLPVLHQGLTHDGVNVLSKAIEAGVRIDVVNIMTMDFGDSAAPPSITMSTHIINSAKSLHAQLTELYPLKNESEIWKMIGLTPMIGVNDVQSEVTTLADMLTVFEFAEEKNLSLLSFWSLTRDFPGTDGVVSPTHNGISGTNDYDFTNSWKSFTKQEL